jgi:hypothetical protein
METSAGFLVRVNGDDILQMGSRVMVFKHVDMNNNYIKNISEPTDDADAATKHYVDANIGPAFSAYGGIQNIAPNTYVKCAFSRKKFDTESKYDTTGCRFTPGKIGKYLVNVNVIFNNPNNIYYGNVFLYLNGSNFGQIAGGG